MANTFCMANKSKNTSRTFQYQICQVRFLWDFFVAKTYLFDFNCFIGVGHSTTAKLSQLNWKTCMDLQQVPLTRLQHELGKKLGETLSKYCRGIDDKPLTYDQVRKSVSAEVNYGIRFTETHELDTFLRQLCTELHNRLIEYRAKGKTITLKYMVRAADAPVETAKYMGHGFCENISKSVTLPAYTCDLDVITQNVFAIKMSLNVAPCELRGIGIQVSKLDTNSDGGAKSNVLRNMFERVTEKNKNRKIEPKAEAPPVRTVTKSSPPAAKPVVDRRKTRTITKPSGKRGLKRTKSFQATANDRDIKEMFTHAAPAPNRNNKVNEMFESIDVDVLAELPEDIREQVLKEQMIVLKQMAAAKKSANDSKSSVLNTSSTSTASSTSNISSIDAESSKNSSACQIDLDNSKQSATSTASKSEPDSPKKESNLLLTPTWRQTLTEWFESTDQPIDVDIDVVAEYFDELMLKRMLCEVDLRLRFIHRVLTPKNCRWHAVYFRMLDLVQTQIVQLYGPNTKLHTNDSIDCIYCNIQRNV